MRMVNHAPAWQEPRTNEAKTDSARALLVLVQPKRSAGMLKTWMIARSDRAMVSRYAEPQRYRGRSGTAVGIYTWARMSSGVRSGTLQCDLRRPPDSKVAYAGLLDSCQHNREPVARPMHRIFARREALVGSSRSCA